MEKITILAKIEDSAHHFLLSMKAQYSETKGTAIIIEKYMKEGTISDEEEQELKAGLVDSLKMAGVMIPFLMVPGASLLMPILIKVADKYNIELLPSAFNDKEEKPQAP